MDEAQIHDSDNMVNNARWAIFALWILALVLAIFLINLRRRRRGLLPIIGTAWLAPPPSYGQSQRHYNMPPAGPGAVPVPEYTSQPSANVDMGYYDSQGKFHPATDSLPKPDPAVTTSTTHEGHAGGPLRADFTNMQHSRPNGPPPGQYSSPASPPVEFQRPVGPPPSTMPGVTNTGLSYYQEHVNRAV